METIIKVSPEEINEDLLNKLKFLVNNKKNIDVTISLNEYNDEYANELDLSISQLENKVDVITMTYDQLRDYRPLQNH